MSKAENKLAEELARRIVDEMDWQAPTAVNYRHKLETVAALLEPHLVGEWQPVADAPKDGRTLLLGYANRSGNWRTLRGQWCSADHIMMDFEEPEDHEEGWYETAVTPDEPPNVWPCNPTHWQPLPDAPPKGEQS